MTLSDLQVFLNNDFSYSCAAVERFQLTGMSHDLSVKAEPFVTFYVFVFSICVE